MLNFFFYSLLVLFLVLCIFLVLLILIQKGRGGGLTSAFGGAGGHTAFGAKTGDVLTWATSIVFGLFLVMAIALNLLADAVHHRTVSPQVPAVSLDPGTLPPPTPAAVPSEPARPDPVVPPVEQE